MALLPVVRFLARNLMYAEIYVGRLVTVDTLYPFGSTLTYDITASAPFTFYIRIPAWAQDSSSISVNGASASSLTPDANSALQSVPVGSGKTTVQLYLAMQVDIEERTNSSIAIYRGPLLYAVEITHNETETAALR